MERKNTLGPQSTKPHRRSCMKSFATFPEAIYKPKFTNWDAVNEKLYHDFLLKKRHIKFNHVILKKGTAPSFFDSLHVMYYPTHKFRMTLTTIKEEGSEQSSWNWLQCLFCCKCKQA